MTVCVPKYNLASLYSVISMYAFRVDSLPPDNQLVCPLLGKTIFPTPRFLQLPILLCAVLKLHKVFQVWFGMSIDVLLVQLLSGQYVDENL